VAMATTAVSEYQEGIELSPEFQFSKIKEIDGDYSSWGSDLRTGAKSACDVGSLPKEKSPFSLEEKDRDFIANWENWDKELDFMAYPYRKKSYFLIKKDGVNDLFDSFRGALWENRGSKRAILTGCIWEGNWTYAKDGIIDEYTGGNYFGHAFAFIGQEIINGEPYLIAQLSNGENIGKGGLFYFNRNVVNEKFIWNGYMFIDIPSDVVKKASWTLKQKFAKMIREYLLSFIK